MLFELLTGQVPFAGGSATEKRAQHSQETAPRADELVPAINEDLANLVAEMIDKERMLRVQTAAHVAHSLGPFVAPAGEHHEGKPPLLAGERPSQGAMPDPEWKPPPKQAAPAAAVVAAVSPVPLVAIATPAPAVKPAARVANTSAAADKQRPPVPGSPRIVVSAPGTGAPRAGANATAHVRQKRSRATWIGLAAAGAVAITAIAVVAAMWTRRTPVPEDAGQGTVTPAVASGASAATDQAAIDPPAKSEAAATRAPVPPATARGAGQVVEIEDDGKALWASPTAGQPLDLRYLPSSAQVFLALHQPIC